MTWTNTLIRLKHLNEVHKFLPYVGVEIYFNNLKSVLALVVSVLAFILPNILKLSRFRNATTAGNYGFGKSRLYTFGHKFRVK